MSIINLIIVSGLLSLVYGFWAGNSVLKADPGNSKMQEISSAIQEGAQAYLNRQYTTIAIVGAVICFLLYLYFKDLWIIGGYLIGAILSLYHLGIEQGFIEESSVCDLKNGSNLLSKEEILKQLQEKNVSCKDVTFKIFGLSLTSYNILISLLICISTGKIYFDYGKNKQKKSRRIY